MRYEMREAGTGRLLGTCETEMSAGALVVAFRQDKVVVDAVRSSAASQPELRLPLVGAGDDSVGTIEGRRKKSRR